MKLGETHLETIDHDHPTLREVWFEHRGQFQNSLQYSVVPFAQSRCNFCRICTPFPDMLSIFLKCVFSFLEYSIIQSVFNQPSINIQWEFNEHCTMQSLRFSGDIHPMSNLISRMENGPFVDGIPLVYHVYKYVICVYINVDYQI